MGNPPVIAIASASKRFPAPDGGFVEALRSVSLEVGANEFITLLGPSGYGKTTLLRAVSGFEDLDNGTITIDGLEMTHVPPYRRPVNTVFQNYALFPHLTVGNNIGYGLEVTGCPRRERDQRVAQALELVGLSGFERRKPRQLSGGQQQRVALATDRKRRRLIGLLAPIWLLLGFFFLAPLSILLVYAFLEPGLYGGVEWNFYHHNFGRILGWADGEFEEFDPIYLSIFARSFRLALTTVIVCLLLCYPAALWVSRLPDRWKSLFLFLITLPFFASLVVRLFAWVLILKPTGWINEMLLASNLISTPFDMLYSEGAVVLGMVYVFIPFMFLPLYASLEKLDRSLLEASEDLGANRLKTFLRVTMPLSVPGMVGGSIIVFIPSLGNFVVPDLLGGAKVLMIGNLVEQQFLQARNWPFGSALAWTIMVAVLVFLLAYASVVSRADALQDDRR